MTYPAEQWRNRPVEEIFSSNVLKHLERVYGDKLGEVTLSLTKPSPEYHFRVNTLKTTPSIVVDRLRRAGIDVYQHPNVQETLFIPVRGPFPVPDRHVKVVVDKFTAESVLLGANVYAPSILNCRGMQKKVEVAITDPEGHVVGAGYALMGEDEVLNQRRGLAVWITENVYGLPSLRETEEFREGLIYPQSFPAILTARILDPKPGETVLDLNCAPGGKLSHVSQLMGNTGLVIGVDRSSHKVSTAVLAWRMPIRE